MTKSFLKIPNKIFEYNLSPKALKVYACLLYKATSLHSVTLTTAQLERLTLLSAKTIRSAIQELERKQLVNKQNRYGVLGYIANRYYITIPTGNWFKLPREVFKTNINATSFVVFCYIHKCMENKTGNAFPSINNIVKATGMSKTSVINALGYLYAYSYINRIKRKYKRTRAYRHNRYLNFKYTKKNRVRYYNTQYPTLSKNNFVSYMDILTFSQRFFKYLFLKNVRGSPKIPQHYIIRTNYIQYKKE